MKQGFLLHDGARLSIDVKDKEFAKTLDVSTTVVDPDLGIKMIKVDADKPMDIKMKVDKDGNITLEHKPSQ